MQASGNALDMDTENVFDNYIFKISITAPMNEWVI